MATTDMPERIWAGAGPLLKYVTTDADGLWFTVKVGDDPDFVIEYIRADSKITCPCCMERFTMDDSEANLSTLEELIDD